MRVRQAVRATHLLLEAATNQDLSVSVSELRALVKRDKRAAKEAVLAEVQTEALPAGVRSGR